MRWKNKKYNKGRWHFRHKSKGMALIRACKRREEEVPREGRGQELLDQLWQLEQLYQQWC
jgi:hypothetical protein